MGHPLMTESVPIPSAESSAAPPVLQIHPGAAATRIWALIACAGTGVRAAAPLPKQFHQIAGQALVLHTLAAFTAVSRVTQTLVVLARRDEWFAELATRQSGAWSSAKCGGPTRAQSVASGLVVLQERGAADYEWVMVHDAARCLVTPELINRLIDACAADPVGGLLAHPVSDTLKLAAAGRVLTTLERSNYWLAQTPQMFRIGMLRAALREAGDRVTDESAAIEALGLSPKLVTGSASNFKVTHAEDFALAQALLQGRRHALDKDLDYDYP